MENNNESNVSWGSVLAGATIAGGAVAALAFFPASLGVVSGFIAANPVMSVGAAAVAGAVATAQGTKKSVSHTEKEDLRRMEAQLEAQMQSEGLNAGPARA